MNRIYECPTCYHYGEEGHVKRNCWKLHSKPTPYEHAAAAQDIVDSIAQTTAAPESKPITF